MIGTWQIFVILFGLALLILPVIALIDIIKSEFPGNNKIVWVLVVLFFPLFGSVIYLIFKNDNRLNKIR